MLTLGICLDCILFESLRQGLSVKTDVATLASSPALKICLSLPSEAGTTNGSPCRLGIFSAVLGA